MHKARDEYFANREDARQNRELTRLERSADDALAEMEVEVRNAKFNAYNELRQRAEQAELERDKWAACWDSLTAERDQYERERDEARAELAAVQGRRCENCKHFIPFSHNPNWGNCLTGVTEDTDDDVYFGFACNRWTAKEAD